MGATSNAHFFCQAPSKKDVSSCADKRETALNLSRDRPCVFFQGGGTSLFFPLLCLAGHLLSDISGSFMPTDRFQTATAVIGGTGRMGEGGCT